MSNIFKIFRLIDREQLQRNLNTTNSAIYNDWVSLLTGIYFTQPMAHLEASLGDELKERFIRNLYNICIRQSEYPTNKKISLSKASRKKKP